MKPQTVVDLPALSIRAEVKATPGDDRTVELVWSTGAGVERYDWNTGVRYLEVLSMDPAHVRLDRLNAGAPVLDSHSAYSVGDVLGAVNKGSARIENGLGLAKARYSKRSSVEEIYQDIVEGIIGNVSIGYRVYKAIETLAKGALMPTRTAIDWEPFEISMVPMPADIGAGVRSGDKSKTNPCVIVTSGRSDDADRIRRYRLALARAV